MIVPISRTRSVRTAPNAAALRGAGRSDAGDLVSPEFYARLRWNFFRMHYQFIMANDRRALYDYFMLVCGPVPLSCWCAPQCAWAKARGRAHGGWRPPAIEAKPPPAPARRSQRETLDASV